MNYYLRAYFVRDLKFGLDLMSRGYQESPVIKFLTTYEPHYVYYIWQGICVGYLLKTQYKILTSILPQRTVLFLKRHKAFCISLVLRFWYLTVCRWISDSTFFDFTRMTIVQATYIYKFHNVFCYAANCKLSLDLSKQNMELFCRKCLLQKIDILNPLLPITIAGARLSHCQNLYSIG